MKKQDNVQRGRKRWMIRPAVLLVLLLVGMAMLMQAGASSQAAMLPKTGVAQQRASGEDKLSNRLQWLAGAGRQARSASAVADALSLPSSGPGSLLQRADGQLLVYIFVEDTTDATVEAIEQVQADVVHVAPEYRVVTAYVAASDLRLLVALPQVIYVQEEYEPFTGGTSPSTQDSSTRQAKNAVTLQEISCTGVTTSEGVIQLKVDQARTKYELDGSGVTVGIISDSYDQNGDDATNAEDDIKSGDLPGVGNPCGHQTPINILSESTESTTDKGRAMMQVVHDLAPEASLAFATAFDGIYSFADNIRMLRDDVGVDVIVDNVFYFTEPFFQDGPINQAIADVTKNGGLYVTMAGDHNEIIDNHNVSSYESPAFRPIDCPIDLGDATCHDFQPDKKRDNTSSLVVGANGRVQIVLQWAEPWNNLKTDLNVYLIDNRTKEILASSVSENRDIPKDFGGFVPYEYMYYENDTGASRNVDIVVSRASGGTPRFKYVLLQRTKELVEVEYKVSDGGDVVGPTIFGHSAAKDAIVVGAVIYYEDEDPHHASSRGPATLYYGQTRDDASTTAMLIPPVQRQKPDIAATNSGKTTFFDVEYGDIYRFFGTSAAASHVAAVAALMKEYANTHSYTLDQSKLEAILEATADPMENGSVEANGSGMVDALAAIPEVRYGVTVTPDERTLTGNVGASVTHSLQVVNSGDDTETYTVTVAGGDWNTTPDKTRIGPLKPGTSDTLNVSVAIPPNTSGGEGDSATVTLQSTTHTGARDSVTIGTATPRNYALTITPASQTKQGEPGSTVSYQVQVENGGNFAEVFYADGDPEWDTIFNNPATSLLGIGKKENLSFDVTIPADAKADDTHTASLTMTARTDFSQEFDFELVTHVITYGVAITPALQVVQADPGQVVQYTMLVSNTGNIADVYEVHVTSGDYPAELEVATYPGDVYESWTYLPVDAHAGKVITVTVRVPSNTPIGDNDTTLVNVTSTTKGNAVSQDTTLKTAIDPRYEVLVTPTRQSQSGSPGSVVSYTLHITNTGNLPDGDRFDVTSSAVWQTMPMTQTTANLLPGEGTSVVLSVTIPTAGIIVGNSDVATIAVRSQHDQEHAIAQQEVTLETMVDAVADRIWLTASQTSISTGASTVVTATVTGMGVPVASRPVTFTVIGESELDLPDSTITDKHGNVVIKLKGKLPNNRNFVTSVVEATSGDLTDDIGVLVSQLGVERREIGDSEADPIGTGAPTMTQVLEPVGTFATTFTTRVQTGTMVTMPGESQPFLLEGGKVVVTAVTSPTETVAVAEGARALAKNVVVFAQVMVDIYYRDSEGNLVLVDAGATLDPPIDVTMYFDGAALAAQGFSMNADTLGVVFLDEKANPNGWFDGGIHIKAVGSNWLKFTTSHTTLYAGYVNSGPPWVFLPLLNRG